MKRLIKGIYWIGEHGLSSGCPAAAKLVRSQPANKIPPSVYNVQWAAPNNNTVPAYFVGYQSISLQERNVPFVDIPATPDADLLFTGELIGCSLVVVSRGTGIRVYHDSRYCSSVLYDNVLMAFTNGSWTLYAQCLGENTQDTRKLLLRDVPESKRVLRYRGNSPLIVKTQYAGPNIERERERLYQLLREAAIEHLGEEKIPTTPDGPFQDFDLSKSPSLSNPAVARTEALRKAMVDLELESEMKRKVDAKLQEAKRQARPENRDDDLYKEYDRLDLDLHVFRKALSDSKSTDATFHWLKLKASQGPQAVVGGS